MSKSFVVHFMQPGLHKVDTGCIKSNDAEKFRGPLEIKKHWFRIPGKGSGSRICKIAASEFE